MAFEVQELLQNTGNLCKAKMFRLCFYCIFILQIRRIATVVQAWGNCPDLLRSFQVPTFRLDFLVIRSAFDTFTAGGENCRKKLNQAATARIKRTTLDFYRYS